MMDEIVAARRETLGLPEGRILVARDPVGAMAAAAYLYRSRKNRAEEPRSRYEGYRFQNAVCRQLLTRVRQSVNMGSAKRVRGVIGGPWQKARKEMEDSSELVAAQEELVALTGAELTYEWRRDTLPYTSWQHCPAALAPMVALLQATGSIQCLRDATYEGPIYDKRDVLPDGRAAWHMMEWSVTHEPPEEVVRDQNGLAHSLDGWAVRYSSGLVGAFWRGFHIRQWRHLFGDKSREPSAFMKTFHNTDLVRDLIERMGVDEFLEKTKARLVNRHADPAVGSLYVFNVPESTPSDVRGKGGMVVAQCGTGRTVFLRVPPTMETALAGQMWARGVPSLPGVPAIPEVRT